MATPTYELITSGTITGSPSAAIQFTSIPQTYKHLHIRMWTHSNRAAGNDGGIQFYLNSNAFTGTDWMNNAVVVSSNANPFAQAWSNANEASMSGISQDTQNSNLFAPCEIWITDYTGTKNKNYIGSSSNTPPAAGTGAVGVYGGYTKSTTAAITSIYMRTNDGSNSFSVGTKYYLYGIA